jgi:hypothetical protein
MAMRDIRCGNSGAVYTQGADLPKARQDRAAVRLTSRMYLGGGVELPAAFRVLGTDARGRHALVCLARTRAEAAARLRAGANGFVLLRLQEWVGPAFAGSWRTLEIRVREGSRLPRRQRLREGS